MITKHNEPLAKYTTYKIGGPAREFLIPESADDILTIAREYAGKRLIILGGGSNTLFGDGPIDAAVVRIGPPLNKCKIENVKFKIEEGVNNEQGTGNSVRLNCESGAALAKAAREACNFGLTGLEWACGIPGTVGGAVAGNAGAFGGCMADVVKSVTAAYPDGFREFSNKQCGFTYRGSIFSSGQFSVFSFQLMSEKSAQFNRDNKCQLSTGLKNGIITAVTLNLKKGDKAEINERINKYAALRRSRQPSGLSAGSVFKSVECGVCSGNNNCQLKTENCKLIPAGLLLDRAGLKGARIGGAYISARHANFIINDGTAAFSDVRDLIEYAASVVWLKYGVRLETEIRIINN